MLRIGLPTSTRLRAAGSAELRCRSGSREGIRQRGISAARGRASAARDNGVDVNAHDRRIALAALEVFELLVDRGHALAGEVREGGVVADTVRAMAVVAGRRQGDTASGVALRQQLARRDGPRDVRCRLPLVRRSQQRGPFSLGKPTARQIALQRLSGAGLRRRQPDEADRRPRRRTAAIVAPIQMANRGSAQLVRDRSSMDLHQIGWHAGVLKITETARSGSRSSRWSGATTSSIQTPKPFKEAGSQRGGSTASENVSGGRRPPSGVRCEASNADQQHGGEQRGRSRRPPRC